MFNAESTGGQTPCMALMIEDNLVNVVVDSVASCNLLSEDTFKFITGGNARLLECNIRVHACASVGPLQLKGKYSFDVQIPQIHKSMYMEFYAMCGNIGTH